MNDVLLNPNLLALAIANLATGIVITDPAQPDNPMIFVNSAMSRMTGYSSEELLGKNCRILQGVDSNPDTIADIRAAIAQGQPIIRTLLNYRKDGTPFWSEININPIFNPEGQLTHFIGLLSDVTERKRDQEALQESQERYALAVKGANDGIWDWNLKTGDVYFSPRWKTMLGYEEHELQNTLDEWFERIHPDDEYWIKRELTAHIEGLTPHFEYEHRIRHRNGSYRWVLTRGLAVRDVDGKATRLAGSQTDITGRKQVEEQLLHDAFHDALTGLPNRSLLMDRLQHAVEMTRRNESFLYAVMFLDIDRFKVINDSLGHMVGDRLLITVAKRLATCLRPGDTVARLGGDEFVILLENLRDIHSATLIAERIRHDLAEPINLMGHEVFVSTSIGIALGSSEYALPEDLLRDADTAMYRAKSQGRDRYEVFHMGMHRRAVTLLRLGNDLRRAVEREELHLHYQPIVSLRDQSLVGFEALVRWRHPEYGNIPPSEFIPIAEDTGLIIPISQWIMQEACHQMYLWQNRYSQAKQFTIHVNLSSKHFAAELIRDVDTVLASTNLQHRQLKLEITESVLMENAETAISILRQLKGLGVQLAIDDFGTGYSSLSYLHRFPIDTLKIDRSFVNKLDSDPEQLAIVRNIMTLAWNLGIDVVAEGVESNKQLLQLKSLQCEYAQGFYFSQPMDAGQAEQLIREPLPWHDVSGVS
ncbi:putative bifunctional diguanylate cyclase/phosphodiesterase [Leptolyngbya sp. AN02str]|uniref:putative bifunctional diguanylate cyclase/phosphodiesterase n=1 Tax=Leptolyngbya sp. AN02str TaxID=3423363 RepID=UPI003D313458